MKLKLVGVIFLMVCTLNQTLCAQETTISGIVSDEYGVLPNVSVVIQASTFGTVTDFNGYYELQAQVGDTIVFSYVGKQTQKEIVGTTQTISINLIEQATQLQDVLLVTSLGIERPKKTLAFQADKVKAKQLVTVTPTRAAQGLTGKVAGLQINNQDHGVNPNTQIIIRGLRSITQSNSALIVIDGSVATQEAFDDLNPLDIESINVLKGTSAGILYGSLGSNGVLIVNTKKGLPSQKFTVGLNSTSTFENVSYMPDFQQKYGMGWAGEYYPVENTNWGPLLDGVIRQIGPTFEDGSFQEVPYEAVKNNLLNFYNTGSTFQNTLYFSGGGKNSSFYLSIGDERKKGVVPDDSYNRNTFRVNASQKLGKLTLNLNSTYLTDKTNQIGSKLGHYDAPLSILLYQVATNIRLTDYKDWQNPESYAYADNYYSGYSENPYWAIGTSRNNDSSHRFLANIQAIFEINKWLNLTGRLGMNNSYGNGKDYRAAQSYNPDLQPGKGYVPSFVIESDFQFNAYTFDLLMDANFEIGKSFGIHAILGGTSNSTASRSSSIQANDLSIPDLFDISNGTGTPIINLRESQKRTYGFFGDATVGYKDLLFLNLAGRYDFTSTLPEDENSYFYPSLGVSFVLSEALPSLKESSTYIKLTLSNSTVYNDLAPYQINETFTKADGFPFGALNGFEQSSVAVDPNIRKEKINTTEIGLNLSLFRNRLIFDAAYFSTASTDLITYATPSFTSGSSSFLTNIGKVEAKGVEFTLGGSILKSTDWGWDLSMNFTSYESKVKEIAEGINEITMYVNDLEFYSAGEVGFYGIVGEAFPQIKASSYVRDPSGRIVVDSQTGIPLKGDLKNMGKTTPDYILGLTSTLRWKTLSFSTTMDYRTGHVFYDIGTDATLWTGRSPVTTAYDREAFVVPNSVIETTPGNFVENTDIKTSGDAIYWIEHYGGIRENFIKDATSFKIREMALFYEIPNKILQNTPIKLLKIGLVARNYFTYFPADNSFSDPEFQNQTVNENAIGIGGYYQPPPTKSLGLNLNIEF